MGGLLILSSTFDGLAVCLIICAQKKPPRRAVLISAFKDFQIFWSENQERVIRKRIRNVAAEHAHGLLKRAGGYLVVINIRTNRSKHIKNSKNRQINRSILLQNKIISGTFFTSFNHFANWMFSSIFDFLGRFKGLPGRGPGTSGVCQEPIRYESLNKAPSTCTFNGPQPHPCIMQASTYHTSKA